MQSGSHVTYKRLESADKDGKHPVSSFPAVILAHDPGRDGSAFVAFLNPRKLHLIGGADWRDAFEGAHSVPFGQGEGRDWYEALPEPKVSPAGAKAVEEITKLKEFILANFKSETGDETATDCAIRLLSKSKKKS